MIIPTIFKNSFKWLFEADEDIEQLKKEAEDYSTPPNRLAELANHENIAIGNAVAENPATPLDALYKLAGYSGVDDEQIKNKELPDDKTGSTHIFHSYLAKNPSTPGWLLKLLSKNHPDEVIQNPVLSLLQLEDPDFFNDEHFRRNIAKSKNLSPELEKMLIHNYEDFRRNRIEPERQTIGHSRYGSTFLTYPKLSQNAQETLVQHPDTHTELLNNMYSTPETHKYILNHVINNTDAPNRDSKLDTLLSSPYTSEEATEYILNNPDNAELFQKALRNKSFSTDELANIYKNLDKSSGKDYWKFNLKQAVLHSLANSADQEPVENIENHFLNKITNPHDEKILLHFIDSLPEVHIKDNNKDYDNFMHILTKHPNKDIRNKALEYSKKSINNTLDDFKYNDKTSKKLGLDFTSPRALEKIKNYAQSETPELRTYVQKHPFVQEKLNQLRSETGVEPEYKLDTNKEPYIADNFPINSPDNEKLRLKTGQQKYNDEIGDADDEVLNITKQKDDQDADYMANMHWQHPQTYNFLSQHENPEVRATLAKNSYTPAETLHSLAYDTHKPTRLAVAEHPNTSHKTLNVLKLDKDPEVKDLASKMYNAKKVKKG